MIGKNMFNRSIDVHHPIWLIQSNSAKKNGQQLCKEMSTEYKYDFCFSNYYKTNENDAHSSTIMLACHIKSQRCALMFLSMDGWRDANGRNWKIPSVISVSKQQDLMFLQGNAASLSMCPGVHIKSRVQCAFPPKPASKLASGCSETSQRATLSCYATLRCGEHEKFSHNRISNTQKHPCRSRLLHASAQRKYYKVALEIILKKEKSTYF